MLLVEWKRNGGKRRRAIITALPGLPLLLSVVPFSEIAAVLAKLVL